MKVIRLYMNPYLNKDMNPYLNKDMNPYLNKDDTINTLRFVYTYSVELSINLFMLCLLIYLQITFYARRYFSVKCFYICICSCIWYSTYRMNTLF